MDNEIRITSRHSTSTIDYIDHQTHTHTNTHTHTITHTHTKTLRKKENTKI